MWTQHQNLHTASSSDSPNLESESKESSTNEEKVDDVDPDRTCVICLSDIRNHMALPCKHVITCNTCSKSKNRYLSYL